MELLPYFQRHNFTGFILYRLNPTDWSDFVQNLTDGTRLCYIDNSLLHTRCQQRGITPGEFLDQYILPLEPTIQSGDFGEIFSYFIVIEQHKPKGIHLVGPRKWRWKEDRNKPSPGSDSLLFHMQNTKKPSPQDQLVSIESKMKSVSSKSFRIQEAIDGAAKDKLSRLAKSLNWLEEKYARNGSEDQRKVVERFLNPSIHGTFIIVNKAIAIIDSTLESGETSQTITNPHGVVVIVFSILNLKDAYVKVRENVIKSI